MSAGSLSDRSNSGEAAGTYFSHSAFISQAVVSQHYSMTYPGQHQVVVVPA